MTRDDILRDLIAAAEDYEETMWRLVAASRIEARSDETPKEVQPEGREPDPKGDAQTQSRNPV